MTSKATVKTVKETEIIDLQTGEIARTENVTTFRVPKEPPFVKLYLDDLSAILDIPQRANSIMYELIKLLDYEGCISLNPVLRNRICTSLGVTDQTFRNSLQKLKKKGLLIAMGTNYFQCNPNYFAKGEWRDVMRKRKEFKEMTLKVIYNKDGNREITANLETKD